MANTAVRLPGVPVGFSASDSCGNEIRNSILLGLPDKESELLFSKLEFKRLRVRHVLHEPGDTIKSAYFVNSGLVSILTVFPDGKCVEVGLVGKEGLVGVPIIAGFDREVTRAVIQIEASVFRIDAKTLSVIVKQSPKLDLRLRQMCQIQAFELAQIAACNRLHEVNERMARWLLMSADRVNSTSLPLTQEFLSHMLGTTRSSVTIAAGILERAGTIANARARIEIIDRARLEKAACDCYGMMRQLEDDLWKSVENSSQ